MLAFPKTVILCSICKTSNCNSKGKSALLPVFSLVWGWWGQSPLIVQVCPCGHLSRWLTWGVTRIFSGGTETIWSSNTGITAYYHSATSTTTFTNRKIWGLSGRRGWFLIYFFKVFVGVLGGFKLTAWFFTVKYFQNHLVIRIPSFQKISARNQQWPTGWLHR